MKTCYLHIGAHKTASTTLQAFLAANAAALQRHGLLFPQIDPANPPKRHHELAQELAVGQKQDCLGALREELRRLKWSGDLIVSAETFAFHVKKPDVRDRLINSFAELGYAITVIAYIRPQLASINSHYTQRIKTLNASFAFNQFVDYFMRTPAYDPESMYAPLLGDKRFTTGFVPFNSTLKAVGICNDFLGRLNLAKRPADSFERIADHNVSPGPKTISAMFRIAKHMERLPVKMPDEVRSAASSMLRKLAHARGWNNEKFNGLTRAHKAAIMENFATANDRFARLAWSRPWRDVFADDEKKAMREPLCVFRLDQASQEEREEFVDFVKSGAAMIRDLGLKERLPASR